VDERRLPGHRLLRIDVTAGSVSYSTEMASAASRADVAVAGHDHRHRFADVADDVHGHARCGGDGKGVPIGMGPRNSAI
jgi:hypothetical protein